MEFYKKIIVDNEVLIQFYDSLENLYKISVDYKNALRAGNQAAINETTTKLTDEIQNMYDFYKKNSSSNKYLADKANELVEQFNEYGFYYNEFVNAPDRMSAKAQGYARFAEISFNSFVEILISYSAELKPYAKKADNPVNPYMNFVGNTIIGSNNQILIGEVHIDNSIKINKVVQNIENSELDEVTKREVLQKLEELKQIKEDKAKKKDVWKRVKNFLKWVAEQSIEVMKFIVPVLAI